MYIYNVTTKINWPIHEEWVQWMKEKHIPDVMQTGCFTESRFARLLETDESEGPTYTVQFYAQSLDHYTRYIEHHAPELRNEVMANWGSNFISFRTLMELVN